MADDALAACGLETDSFDDALESEPIVRTNLARAIVAGCRRRLLTDHRAALEALAEGFTFGGRVDLRLQLAQHRIDDLQLLLQGKASLSAQDVLDCFDWSEPHSSPAVAHLRELLSRGTDEGGLDESQRFLLLRWCTGRNTLPVSGLEKKVGLILDDTAGPADQRIPVAHTCSYEIDLPSYSSGDTLCTQLLCALRHFERDASFQQQ